MEAYCACGCGLRVPDKGVSAFLRGSPIRKSNKQRSKDKIGGQEGSSSYRCGDPSIDKIADG